MASVSASSSIRTPTVSAQAVTDKFAGHALAGWEAVFLALAQQYRIDPNWALAYLQWESRFGDTSPAPTNPWDILCYPGQWGATGQVNPGNGYCYASYPDVATGLEAGFRLWSSYADQGYGDWFSSLSRALCGNPSGCDSGWVGSVIAQGQQNAAAYPADGSVSTPIATPPKQASVAGIPDVAWLFVAGAVVVRALWQ